MYCTINSLPTHVDFRKGHPTVEAFTTPEQFKANVLGTLKYIDAHIAPGSHVVFIGLADGRALYDALHNRQHPIGATYVEVYNYLNCLQINPCWGWLNSDANVRNATTQRAEELTQVYNEVLILSHTLVLMGCYIDHRKLHFQQL